MSSKVALSWLRYVRATESWYETQLLPLSLQFLCKISSYLVVTFSAFFFFPLRFQR